MINLKLVNLLESNDVLEVLKDSIKYQMQKINNIEKSSEGREWFQELPPILKTKFENYKKDYENMARIFSTEQDQIKSEMNKGYYYWRLLHSACNTYRNDMVEFDQQLNHEFNFKLTDAISDNTVLNECIGILEQHVTED